MWSSSPGDDVPSTTVDHVSEADSAAVTAPRALAPSAPPTAPPEVLDELIERVDDAWARGDTDTALRALAVGLWPLLVDRPSELARLLAPVPEDAAPPALLLVKRYALPVLERPERIRLLASRPLDSQASATPDSPLDHAWHITHRMIAHRLRGELVEAREVGQCLRQILETEGTREPSRPPPFLPPAYLQLGTTELLAGGHTMAVSDFQRGLAATDAATDLGVRRDAMIKLACVFAADGRLRDAETMIARAEREREPRNASSDRIRARTRLARALVGVERLDPRAPELLENLDHDLLFEYWPLVLLAQGRWALATGNPAGALDLVDAATEDRPLSPDSLGLCVATLLRDTADELLGMPLKHPERVPDSLPPLCALGAARGAILRSDPLAAVRTARALAQRRGIGPSVRLEALLLTALAAQRAGLPSDERVNAAAAGLAQQEGLWRPLVVVPASVRDGLPIDLPPHVGDAVVPAPPPAVVLTRREREVLAALAGSSSLAEIARELHVSVNTVKSQVRSLYRALGVSSRHEAVAEATRRGLVSLSATDAAG